MIQKEIQKDYHRFRNSSEEKAEAASRYKFDFCLDCPFYECELVEEYTQFRKNHAPAPIHKSQSQVPVTVEIVEDADSFDYTKDGGVIVQAIEVSVKCNEQDNERSIFLTDSLTDDTESSDADILSYDQSKLKDGCIMNFPHVYQVECGRKNVTEGIGDHYKIEIIEELKKDWLSREKIIKKGTTDRWEPAQPVFISAQTGQGKNYFIDNTLIPYVRDLNYREKTDYKILIFSNRLALKQQIKNRIDGNDDLDDEEGKIYSYEEVADVMTYQSLLSKAKYLKDLQKRVYERYIYVVCDEAHFFTSDAMFNPYTYKILQTIVGVFQDAVRIYMSATPDECLEHIIKCEDQFKYKYEKMLFYHFKRDYSYLDIKAYSSINELYGEIVESVNQRKEKWLIFIDDITKCETVKNQLKKFIRERECSLVVEDDEAKKKDGKGNKDDNAKKKVEKVYAVNANSKKDLIYQEIVKNERLNKDTYVLISTSVLDNGINLTGIKNIVVSDMTKTKCLQMLGRARVKGDDDRKILYIKRFSEDEVEKRITGLKRQQDAYHDYELAYGELRDLPRSRDYSEYKFLNKYYNSKDTDWKDAKRWFGRPMNEPTKLYLNEIAKSLVDRQILCYKFIRDEMVNEGLKGDEQQKRKNQVGQKYLEYQLSWFGKKYCEDDDITYADKEKAKKEFIDFLESYADSGEEIDGTEKMMAFQAKFTKLHDAVFPRADKNPERFYKYKKMNDILKAHGIEYKIDGSPQKGPWIVVNFNWSLN